MTFTRNHRNHGSGKVPNIDVTHRPISLTAVKSILRLDRCRMVSHEVLHEAIRPHECIRHARSFNSLFRIAVHGREDRLAPPQRRELYEVRNTRFLGLINDVASSATRFAVGGPTRNRVSTPSRAARIVSGFA